MGARGGNRFLQNQYTFWPYCFAVLTIYLKSFSIPLDKIKTELKLSNYSVPGAGIEPARPYGHKILSLACLPISPPGHWAIS